MIEKTGLEEFGQDKIPFSFLLKNFPDSGIFTLDLLKKFHKNGIFSKLTWF